MRAITPLLVLALLAVPAQALAAGARGRRRPLRLVYRRTPLSPDQPWYLQRQRLARIQRQRAHPYYLVIRSPEGRRWLLGFSEARHSSKPMGGWAMFRLKGLEELVAKEPTDHWILEIHARFVCLHYRVIELNAQQIHLPALTPITTKRGRPPQGDLLTFSTFTGCE